MRREQLEANWGWDNERGSIPFQRPRLTPKNIGDQELLARPGTLIHCSSKPCLRGSRMVDTVPIIGAEPPAVSMSHADHIENVNCLACRKAFFEREKSRRARRK